jgi:hypothetical protein
MKTTSKRIQTDSLGCSDSEPDTESVDLTPVSEMSLGKDDLTGLLTVLRLWSGAIAHH